MSHIAPVKRGFGIGVPALLGFLALVMPARARPVHQAPNNEVSVTRQGLVGGEKVDEPEWDGIVYMVAHDPDRAGSWHCTATLVADTLLLTAARCVAPLSSGALLCRPDGQLANPQDAPLYPLEAEAIVVYADFQDQYRDRELARGRSLLVKRPSLIGCVNQLALVELDRTLDDGPVLPMRLGPPVQAGDEVQVFGFGKRSNLAFSPDRNRVTSKVRSVGPDRTDDEPERDGHRGTFTLAIEGLLERDLGGPVVDADGRIVGVVFSDNGDGEAMATHLPSHADFIRAQAQAAGIELPEADLNSQANGCSVLPVASKSSGPAWLALLGLMGAAARARREKPGDSQRYVRSFARGRAARYGAKRGVESRRRPRPTRGEHRRCGD